MNENVDSKIKTIKKLVSKLESNRPEGMSWIQGDSLKGKKINDKKLFSDGKTTSFSPRADKKKVYNFKYPFYVRLINFVPNNKKQYPDLFVEVQLKENNEWKQVRLEKRTEGFSSYAVIKDIINAIRIKSGSNQYKETIDAIQAFGINFEDFREQSEKIDDSAKNINELTNKIESTVSELSTLEPALENLNLEKNEKQKELESLKSSIETSKDNLDELEKAEELRKETEEKVKKLDIKYGNLLKEIDTKEQELKKLKSNINAYSEDFQHYSKLKGKHANTFLGIGLFFIIVLIYIFYILIGQTNNALDSYKANIELDYKALFSLKIFYGALIFAIIYFFGKSASILIKRAFSLLKEERDMNALSVLSANIIESSTSGLEIKEEDIIDMKVKFKIQLLSNSMYREQFESLDLGFLDTFKKVMKGKKIPLDDD